MRKRGFEICNEFKSQNINLPTRKTMHSVGYDIEAADTVIIPSIWKTIFSNLRNYLNGCKNFNKITPILIPTGLKAYFLEDEVLILANKSSFPLKFGLILANGIGIIDSDYYENKTNDGHIQFMYYNISFKDITIKKGEVIGQAYFQKFLIADNDIASNHRTGGFGSTSKM
mgnify:FL=1